MNDLESKRKERLCRLEVNKDECEQLFYAVLERVRSACLYSPSLARSAPYVGVWFSRVRSEIVAACQLDRMDPAVAEKVAAARKALLYLLQKGTTDGAPLSDGIIDRQATMDVEQFADVEKQLRVVNSKEKARTEEGKIEVAQAQKKLDEWKKETAAVTV